MLQNSPLLTILQSQNIQSIILCGVETHICILQTALDLLRHGFTVYIVRDAVASQRLFDHDTAIQRLTSLSNKIILTTVESIIYELLQDARHPSFKSILAIIKERNSLLHTNRNSK